MRLTSDKDSHRSLLRDARAAQNAMSPRQWCYQYGTALMDLLAGGKCECTGPGITGEDLNERHLWDKVCPHCEHTIANHQINVTCGGTPGKATHEHVPHQAPYSPLPEDVDYV